MILKIGTRGSQLALAQSQWVKEKIEDQYSHVQVKRVKIRTTGDKILDSPLSQIGGKGLFVKEIEDALLKKDIDVAVHSVKDIPAELPGPLMLSSFPEREDPRDALMSVRAQNLDTLPQGSRVGTQHHTAAGLESQAEGVEQARLAAAGLTRQQRHTRAAATSLIPQLEQLAQLAIAAHQRCRHRLAPGAENC